ncbi:MAG: dehydrogenase, partial [Acidobacteria bacterium]|nr:dehydrogenase [Acidobacteriota bacterium]
MRTLLVALCLLTLLLGACGRSGPPYSPEQALKTFQIESGFRMEIFATEPQITSPVAMEFDENGRIYVVENPGYPLDTEHKLGRVKLLEDTDGDGRPNRVTVFADQLVLPTGVMRWKKGILVTDAPDVWYFEDTNGDGKADIRRVVLTGFAFTNPQHTVNNPMYGLDNWIYLAHEGPATAIVFTEKFGDRGSPIRFPDRSDLPGLNVGRHNVRFRPDTYELEALSGSSQFGQAFDQWGHHFTLDNSNHVRHEVIPARYLQRNPDLLISSAMQDISDHGAAAVVFPITVRPEFQMLTDVGQFTSACGLTLYLGGAFPSGFDHSSFVAEPAHNLVHRDDWSQAGPSFLVRRAQERVEFLASTDSWFRPVNFYVGPDGALYLLDYYRRIIEHPEWMATHTHHSKDLYAGQDRGRIYRIVPDKNPPPRPAKIRLGDASEEELAHHLENPNIWWRRTAQRLLVDRRSEQAVELLNRLFASSRSPVGRLHALWTLEGLGKLDTALIERALSD